MINSLNFRRKKGSNLGHDNDFISRQVELFDCLSKNDFRYPVGVNLDQSVSLLSRGGFTDAYIRCIKCIDPSIVAIRRRVMRMHSR